MSVLTASSISSLALELLTRSLVLPRTVARPPGSEFSGPNGATITVRVRQAREAKIQSSPGAPISYEGIDEKAVHVTLSHLYDATRLTDEDLTLNLESFGAQVLAPQVDSVARAAEDELAAVMNNLDTDMPVDPSDAEAVETAILEAREQLTRAGCPAGGRWLAVSPEFATPILSLDKFSRVDASGSPSALRDAVIGRVYGLTCVESAALDPGTALAYHESGFAFANRAPAIPSGAADAAIANRDGIALRALRDFDPGILSDVSVISTFAGAAVVWDDGDGLDGLAQRPRVIKLGTSTTSS